MPHFGTSTACIVVVIIIITFESGLFHEIWVLFFDYPVSLHIVLRVGL
jgi:hypothetical protein